MVGGHPRTVNVSQSSADTAGAVMVLRVSVLVVVALPGEAAGLRLHLPDRTGLP